MGVSVHRADCPNVISMPEEEKARFINVSWDGEKLDQSYNTDITIIARDRKGLFSAVSKVCEDLDVNISGVNARTDKDENVQMNLTLSISNKAEMNKILRSLKSVQGVSEVYRAKL